MDDRLGPAFNHYRKWNEVRIARIIKHYGPNFFRGKSLLEVGTLTGANGNAFHELGAIVMVQDVRDEHVRAAVKQYPHLDGYVHDLNNGLGVDYFFDVIVHMGVLYHLESMKPLRDACAHCNHLILETQILDSSDVKAIHVKENSNTVDHSFTGTAIRPSPSLVEKVLEEEGFSFIRVRDELDCHGHVYSMKERNTGKAIDGDKTLRGMWFCEKKKNVA